MKKKASVLLIVLVMLSGCLSPNSGVVEYVKTRNGSVILTDDKGIKSLCSKKSLDQYLLNNDPDAIKSEFNINNYEQLSYEKNKTKYQELQGLDDKCQYQVFVSDFAQSADWVRIAKISLEENQSISVDKILEEKLVKDFIKSSPNTVVGQVTHQILNNATTSSIIQKELTAKKAGEYQVIARPIYRMYHFKDRKLIYDFDFSTIRGLSLELELIQ